MPAPKIKKLTDTQIALLLQTDGVARIQNGRIREMLGQMEALKQEIDNTREYVSTLQTTNMSLVAKEHGYKDGDTFEFTKNKEGHPVGIKNGKKNGKGKTPQNKPPKTPGQKDKKAKGKKK